MTDETTQTISQQASAGIEGKRARRAFMPRFFLPAEPDWVTKNVVLPGKGTKVALGRVIGVCDGVERKTNNFQDKVIESIVLKGRFETEDYTTGEIGNYTTAYLPMAYAEMIEAYFKTGGDDVKSVEVDADIGLEATGKSIPYEWVVIHYTETQAFDVLALVRNRRKSVRQLRLEAEAQAQLTDQSGGAAAKSKVKEPAE